VSRQGFHPVSAQTMAMAKRALGWENVDYQHDAFHTEQRFLEGMLQSKYGKGHLAEDVVRTLRNYSIALAVLDTIFIDANALGITTVEEGSG
jgi:hypothetical protein